LRDQKALDREAAVQMALALADKRSFAEAAQVLEPFADQAPTDIELNALIGRLYIDVSALDRATVYVQRAVQTANGKSAEALFQYGRLAFKRGDVSQGISRMKQAIDTDRLAHQYRFELAKFLLDVKGDAKARKVAIDELETIVRSAEGLAKADRPVQNLAEVHRQLARGFMEEHDYQKAAKNLELATELVPSDLEGRAELGKALYYLRDERAGPVLRSVLSRKPGDGKASLYLALHLLGKRRPAEALPLLQSAAQTGDVRFAEAWFHMALIQKERENLQQALRDVEQYLERGPRDGTYRGDAESLRRTLQAAIQGRSHK
jgi:tetratricopeptide (TPR) repeat protein